MISEEDRAALADLAMRALDEIESEYGGDADLTAAVLVFEVRVPDSDGDARWHGNFKSLEHNSPHHIAGLLDATAAFLQTPIEDDE